MRHFHQAEARFKAVRVVAHKARPQVAARDQLAQIGHHLTAVAHAERQGLRTMEEGRELIAHALVEQNRLRPAFTCPQHVAVGEAAAGHQGMEIAETGAARQQVAHMHVNGVKASAMEGRRHFNVRVHTLLAQDGHFRTRAGGNVRCGDIVINIKRELHIEARVGVVGFRLVLLIGAGRVVAQTLHLPGGFRPPHAQRGAAFAKHRLIAGGQHEAIALDRFTEVMHTVRQAVNRQNGFHRLTVCGADLDHRPQLFVEQRRQTVVAQRGDIRLHTAVAGKGHFRQGDQQAAVGAVVVGQQFTLRHQGLHRIPEAFQLRDIAHVSRLVAELAIDLRQRRRAQRVVPFTEVDQQQGVIFRRELRRDGMTNIFDTGEGGDHQRQRRGHLTLLAAFLPAGFHRH